MSSTTQDDDSKLPAFPKKIFDILSQESISDIITWMPNGKSWRILRPAAFEDEVLPSYFPGIKYSSFKRQVNAWGFKRITEGFYQNSYYHDMFVRDEPDLMKNIVRQPHKNSGSSTSRSSSETKPRRRSVTSARSSSSSRPTREFGQDTTSNNYSRDLVSSSSTLANELSNNNINNAAAVPPLRAFQMPGLLSQNLGDQPQLVPHTVEGGGSSGLLRSTAGLPGMRPHGTGLAGAAVDESGNLMQFSSSICGLVKEYHSNLRNFLEIEKNDQRYTNTDISYLSLMCQQQAQVIALLEYQQNQIGDYFTEARNLAENQVADE